MDSTSSTIAKLKTKWPNLHDLHRAKAVRNLKRSGTSNRQLAEQLEVAESGIRRLLKALDAPAEDRLLASQGKISMNELLRRGKAVETRLVAKKLEAKEFNRKEASVVGCKAICNWLRSEGIPGSYGEQIICAAQRQLAIEEENNWFPTKAPPPGMSTVEIVQRCRPAGLKNDEVDPSGRLAKWLVLWAFFSMPDSSVRYNALEQAYEKQFKR
jgi:lambda repressor-like predicted transcriptional regulator